MLLNILLQANEAGAEITEAAEKAAESSGGGWVGTVMVIIGSLITIFLLPYLRQKANAAREEARIAAAEANGKELNNIDYLKAAAKSFAFDTAASMAEKNFPQLAQKIKDGGFSGDDKVGKVKEELYSWGRTLKDKTIEHFADQGIDIVAALGDKYLDQLIELVANKVSPFPGKDTAKALLIEHDGKAIEWLLTKGVDWVRSKTEKENAEASTG